jgi:hypothetical protein
VFRGLALDIRKSVWLETKLLQAARLNPNRGFPLLLPILWQEVISLTA